MRGLAAEGADEAVGEDVGGEVMTDYPRSINRNEFDQVVEAVWSEIEYQNNLSRRTSDEAKDVAGFATLARIYCRKLEDDWADNPGPIVEPALHDLRKLAAIFVRAMIYCGVRHRGRE